MWTMLVFFAWVIWFWLLITVFGDVFRRRDLSGWGKAAWLIFVILVPYFGVFIYLIAEHDGMAERNEKQMQQSKAQMDDYVKSVASASDPAEQICPQCRSGDLLPLGRVFANRGTVADEASLDHLMRQFAYCFVTPLGTEYPPIITGHAIPEPFRTFEIHGAGGPIPVLAFWQAHGPVRSLGFRFGTLAYSSDVSGLDESAFAALEGVETWIVDALRYRAHPTHANIETALSWIARIKPSRAILTNMHIDIDYAKLAAELPAGVEPAYDGMTLDVPL
jgi:hypothetical protein